MGELLHFRGRMRVNCDGPYCHPEPGKMIITSAGPEDAVYCSYECGAEGQPEYCASSYGQGDEGAKG